MILNDFFNDFIKAERFDLIHMLTRKEHPWTLVVVSNDPVIMAACDRVVLLEDGLVKAEGPFESLVKSGELNNIIN